MTNRNPGDASIPQALEVRDRGIQQMDIDLGIALGSRGRHRLVVQESGQSGHLPRTDGRGF